MLHSQKEKMGRLSVQIEQEPKSVKRESRYNTEEKRQVFRLMQNPSFYLEQVVVDTFKQKYSKNSHHTAGWHRRPCAPLASDSFVKIPVRFFQDRPSLREKKFRCSGYCQWDRQCLPL